MYILTVFMHTLFLHSVTRFGGIGATILMVGDGTVLIIVGDIIRVIGEDGMATIGVVGTEVVIGDITIIIVPIGDWVEGIMLCIPIGVRLADTVPIDLMEEDTHPIATNLHAQRQFVHPGIEQLPDV